MIITGIFLFLLGTKIGQAATKTEVKYEGPEKITVIEEKDDMIVLPGLGCPPFAPKFFHQGSNFYFNPQVVMPEGIIPTIERVIPFQPPNVIESKPIVEMIVPELPSIAMPPFKIEKTIPQLQVEIERLPIGFPVPDLNLQPPFQVLLEDPERIIPTIERVIPFQPPNVIESKPIVEMIVPELPSIGMPQFGIEKTIPQLQVEIERLPIGFPVPDLNLQPPFQVLLEDPERIIPTIERVIPFQPPNVIESKPIVEMIVPELPSIGMPQFGIEKTIPQLQVEIERLPIGFPVPDLNLQPPFQVLLEDPERIIPTIERVIPFQPPNVIESKPIVEMIVPELPSIGMPQFGIEKPIPQLQVEIERLPIGFPVPDLNLQHPFQVLLEDPERIIPTIERVIPFQPPNVIESKPIVEMIVPELPSIGMPQFGIEKTIPQLQVEIERLPIGFPVPDLNLQPPFQVLLEDPSKLTVPCEDIEINNINSGVPMLIEKQIQPSGGLYISEVNVRVDEIPPAPELPPLIISEILKPVIVKENKRVILIPSGPELTEFYPPSVVVSENPLNLMDCTQNIILERFLPNILFENDRNLVELISIPANKRAPVVSSIIY